jgi:hypothetical protein
MCLHSRGKIPHAEARVVVIGEILSRALDRVTESTVFKFTNTQYLTFSRPASNHGDSVQKRMTESDARCRLGKRELSQTFRPSAPDLDEVRPRILVRARE